MRIDLIEHARLLASPMEDRNGAGAGGVDALGPEAAHADPPEPRWPQAAAGKRRAPGAVGSDVMVISPSSFQCACGQTRDDVAL